MKYVVPSLLLVMFLFTLGYFSLKDNPNECTNCNLKCHTCKNCKCDKCECEVKKKFNFKVETNLNKDNSPVGAFQSGGSLLNGETITCDLPLTEHLQNKGGNDRTPYNPSGEPGKGSGLCVFTSLEHCAKWQNVKSLMGFRDFMTNHPGGGWPGKVDEFIPKMSQSKGLPTPSYIQHEGGDIEFLKLALKTGRIVAVTYAGRDGVFYNQSINHMVNLVHLSDKHAVILDNNNPGKYLWISPPEDFLVRWKANGGGWGVVLLNPGPPPIPKNWKLERSIVSLNSVEWGNDKSTIFNLNKEKPLLGISEDGVEVYRGTKLDNKSEVDNYGIQSDLIKTSISYRMNGREITKDQAHKVMANKLVDDSKLYRLTINLDNEAIRTRIENDIQNHPALIKWKDRLLIQSYDTNDWATKGVGHKPGIIFQTAPDEKGYGEVLFRMTEYRSPEHLAEALRVADQNYNSEKDKNPSNDSISLEGIDLKNIPMWVYGVLGLGAFLLFSKQNSKNK